MRLLGNGNVGIGTTTPTAKLEVQGEDVKFTSSVSGEDRFLFHSGDDGGSATLSIYDSQEDERFRLNSNPYQPSFLNGGNFGIGTTTPNAKLDVNGDTIIRGDTEFGGEGKFNEFVSFLGSVDFDNNVGFNSYVEFADEAEFTGTSVAIHAPLLINNSLTTKYTITTTNYTILDSDYAIEVRGNDSVITLPTAVGSQGRVYEIDNASGGDVTLDTTGTETINGELTQIITRDSNFKVQSNGTNWRIK
jgi:hypothetical protein